MIEAAAATFLGFACGSIPFGYLVVKLRTGRDIRDVGSGNIGATNAGRVLGRAGGALVLLLDASKGAVSVAVALRFGTLAGSAAATAAVFGHCYSPWLGGRGGKGMATLLGAFGVLTPAPTAGAALALGAVALATRMMSAGSIAGALALPLAALAWVKPASPQAATALVGALVVWRHRGNIVRILQGTERRLGEKEP